METKSLKNLYGELLSSVDKSILEDTSLFFPQIGERYFGSNKRILFIGKAVNGWSKTGKEVEILFDNQHEERFINWDNQLEWLEKNLNREKYNVNRSAFWRVIKKVSKRLFSNEEWYKHIAWTNLYKLAPFENGNPSAKLKKVQRNCCTHILFEEIQVLRPTHVVFLTSGWEWFLKEQMKSCKSIEFAWDKRIEVVEYRDILFIHSLHPQGKPEDSHVEEIYNLIIKY